MRSDSEQLRDIARFILKGCEIAPAQAFTTFYDYDENGTKASCAYAAAKQGWTEGRTDDIEFLFFSEAFPVLVSHCPYYTMPGFAHIVPRWETYIFEMNDDMRMTREQIAERLIEHANEMEKKS